MLHRNSIVAFVPIRDPAKAREFYETCLGLQFIRDEPFALVFDANGTMIRLAKVSELSPAPYTVLGWMVEDIAATVTALKAKGVEFQRYDGLAQDHLAICTFPEGDKVAWFKDPDGNVLSLTEFAGGRKK